MEKYKVITPEEEAKILGMTQEEIESEFEEYETGNWSLPQNARVYTGDVMEFFSKTPSERASFVLPRDEFIEAKRAAEVQDVTFSKFCRRAVKAATKAVFKKQAEAVKKVAL